MRLAFNLMVPRLKFILFPFFFVKARWWFLLVLTAVFVRWSYVFTTGSFDMSRQFNVSLLSIRFYKVPKHRGAKKPSLLICLVSLYPVQSKNQWRLKTFPGKVSSPSGNFGEMLQCQACTRSRSIFHSSTSPKWTWRTRIFLFDHVAVVEWGANICPLYQGVDCEISQVLIFFLVYRILDIVNMEFPCLATNFWSPFCGNVPFLPGIEGMIHPSGFCLKRFSQVSMCVYCIYNVDVLIAHCVYFSNVTGFVSPPRMEFDLGHPIPKGRFLGMFGSKKSPWEYFGQD